MRAVWNDLGQDCYYAKYEDNGITWPYFDIRDPRLTPAYLDAVKAHPVINGVGVYAVRGTDSWPETNDLTPAEFAEWVDTELKRIAWLGNPPVMLDIEVPPLAAFCGAALTRWRELRPKRITDLTVEGHKGGLFGMPDVFAIGQRVRWIVPQCYSGDPMVPWDTYAICADLMSVGFPATKVRPFCDGAALQPWWGIPDGFAFTQGRLP